MKSLYEIFRDNGLLDQCEAPEELLKFYTFPEAADIDKSDVDLRRAIHKVFKGKCPNTGLPIPFDEMTVDHIIPSASMGPNNVYNYALSARRPNSIKSDFLDVNAVIGLLYTTRAKADRILEVFKQIKKKKAQKTLSPEEKTRRAAIKAEKRREKEQRAEKRKKEYEKTRNKRLSRERVLFIQKKAKEVSEKGLTAIELLNCPIFPEGAVVLLKAEAKHICANPADVLREMIDNDEKFDHLSESDIRQYRYSDWDITPGLIFADNWCYAIAKKSKIPAAIIFGILFKGGGELHMNCGFNFVPRYFAHETAFGSNYPLLRTSDHEIITSSDILWSSGDHEVIYEGLSFELVQQKDFEEIKKLI